MVAIADAVPKPTARFRFILDRRDVFGSILVAPENVGGEFEPFPEGFDHMRSIPVRTHAQEPASHQKTAAS